MFYFSMKTCCVWSLEVPHWGTSNDYTQHKFSWGNKKNNNTFLDEQKQKGSVLSGAILPCHWNERLEWNIRPDFQGKKMEEKTTYFIVVLLVVICSRVKFWRMVWPQNHAGLSGSVECMSVWCLGGRGFDLDLALALNFCNLSKQSRPWSDIILRYLIWVCTVCQFPSPCFTDNPLYTTLLHHSDKNSVAMHNHYLDFIQTGNLISLVNDYHVDNNFKEIWGIDT